MTTPAQLMRVYLDEGDRFGDRPAYVALVERLREMGVGGASVFKGIEGFGARRTVHAARVFDLSTNLPVVVEVIERAEKIEAIVSVVREIVADGLLTLEGLELLRLGSEAGE